MNSLSTLLHKHLLVVQNNVRPPNLIRWNPYEFNPIILNRGPSQFVVVPHLKKPQHQAPSTNIVASLMTSHKGQKLLTCLSHRLVSIIWFTSSWRDKKGDLVSRRRGNNELMSDVIFAIALSRSKIRLVPLPLWPVEIWRPQTPLWLDQRHFPPVGWTGCTSWTTSEIIGPPPLTKNSLMKERRRDWKMHSELHRHTWPTYNNKNNKKADSCSLWTIIYFQLGCLCRSLSWNNEGTRNLLFCSPPLLSRCAWKTL